MGFGLTRTLRRVAVSAVVLLAPLAVAGTAQAAIAGANPGTTPDRPDLVSAHILSTSEVQVCFDKPVSSVVGGDFYLAGYDAGNTQPDTGSTAVDASNGNCVDAMYSATTIGDIDQYTAVDVTHGAVTYASTGLTNRADSTTLAESSTHNGTTNLTTAPNLQSILAPTSTETSNNELVFQFDKSVNPSSLTPIFGDDFEIWNASGAGCTSDGDSIVPNTNGQDVLVSFLSACMSVSSAIQGNVLDDTLDAASDTSAIVSQQSTPVPNAPSGGKPVYAPYLLSAKLDPNNPDGIIYTFNQNVTIGSNHGYFCFSLVTGYNGEICANDNGGTVSQLTPTTVEATFGGALASQQEYAVQAQVYGTGTTPIFLPLSRQGNTAPQIILGSHEPSIYNNCGESLYCGAVYTVANGTNDYNIDQSVAIGDNANAFARGFTTSPDVTGVQMQGSNALVTMDQRLCIVGGGPSSSMCSNGSTSGTAPVDVSNINVYQGAGNDATDPGTHPSGFVVNSPDQGAGPQSVTLLSASGKFIQFVGCLSATSGTAALEGTLGSGESNHSCDAFNIDQIVQPIGTAAIAKATHAIRAKQAYVRKHHLRSRTRRLRRRARSW